MWTPWRIVCRTCEQLAYLQQDCRKQPPRRRSVSWRHQARNAGAWRDQSSSKEHKGIRKGISLKSCCQSSQDTCQHWKRCQKSSSSQEKTRSKVSCSEHLSKSVPAPGKAFPCWGKGHEGEFEAEEESQCLQRPSQLQTKVFFLVQSERGRACRWREGRAAYRYREGWAAC